MEVVYWDTVTPPPACCVANVLSVGNFDGVHQGHRALLRRLSRLKQRLGARSMVITFDPPPQALLRPQTSLPPLTTIAQRLRIIERLNVDVAMVLVTTPRLLSLTSSEFLNDLLAARLQLRGMVEGRNFGFGKDRTGDIATLEAWCAGRDISLEIVDDVHRQSLRISSSTIRTLLSDGNVERARRALGRPYSISGQVVRGDERGRRIGFPTANLDRIETLVPGLGVYAAVATTGADQRPAAVNIGPNPTFGVSQRKVEAHLLDFTGDLYHAEVTVEFLARLRDTRPFPSLSALQAQLAKDVETTRQIAVPFMKRVHRERRRPH